MCDIDKETRRLRYYALRAHGYKRGFAQRARDFTNKRYQDAINRNAIDILICNICNDGQQWSKK
jgi:hypothetical protein